jgi:hypothetical protein
MPGNYPEESIQHSEHGESLKSRIFELSLPFCLYVKAFMYRVEGMSIGLI